MFFRLSCVWCFMLIQIYGQYREGDNEVLEEYCISEIFRPQCSQNEVILIERALFGRRILGRCLEKDKQEMKYLSDEKAVGCFSDVQKVINPLCSLKQSCEVRVVELNVDVPCYSYLRYFLEVKYSCVKSAQENRDCVMDLKNDKEHIIGNRGLNSGCGKHLNPWKIRTFPGQKINISVIQLSNFDSNNDSSTLSFSQNNMNMRCSGGFIRDVLDRKDTSICYGKISTEQINYISSSNNLEIIFNEEINNKAFLLAIEATGCSDLIPPADAWLKRTENEATIGCYSTRLRWQLKCVGQRWIGVIGNCSQGVGVILNTKQTYRKVDSSWDEAVLIIGIVTAGVVICIFISCVGVVFLKRYYAMNKFKTVTKLSMLNSPHYQTNIIETSIPHNKGLSDGNMSKDDIVNSCYYQDNGSNSLLKNTTHYFELDQATVNSNCNGAA